MQIVTIHPQNPQNRAIASALTCLNQDGVIACPTSTGYNLICQTASKKAAEKIRCIRNLPQRHFCTLLCANLSHLSIYAHVDNVTYRLLKHHTPGPCTFILVATNQVPKRLVHRKRKTIGLKIPQHPVCQAILKEVNALMSVSILSFEQAKLHYEAMTAEDIPKYCHTPVDMILDSGPCITEISTIVNCTQQPFTIVRQGIGTIAT